MKKIYIILAIFCLCCLNLFAQHQITGIVKEGASDDPVQFATAALLRTDSTAITGVITGKDGKFVINNVATGNYLLLVSLIGYEKAYRSVQVPEENDLGVITLAESATRIKEVVVTATRPLVVNRADRYVVNVSGNIQSAGRDALDILRNTPGVLVNQQGGISVLGGNVQVWMDGRPLRMSGEQLQAFLNSMRGGDIDRIEVITNPSSRYDAAGGGGIIDIRTKRGLQFGVNGTITAGYQQGRMDRENGGISLNWRREKFNMFGNYSVNRTNSWEKLSQINVMQTTAGEVTFDQSLTGKNTKAGLRNNIRGGIDYFINPKNTLGFIVNAYYSNGGNSSLKGFTQITPTYHGVSATDADNTQSRNSNGIQVNANYQATFKKPGKQLNIDLDWARFGTESFQQNKNIYYDKNHTVIGLPEQFRNSNPQVIDVYSGKVDYALPLWKNARMETGIKVSQSKTNNDLQFDLFTGSNWQMDANRTNRFVYTEQIDAAYLNISQKLGKFNLQAGLRGEYTLWDSEQKTTDEKNDTTYFNLFPTFFVNYQVSSKHNFGLSYSRRLSRPGYALLNPFEVTIDAYSFTRGNPSLMPSYTHNIQLSYSYTQTLMARFSYSNSTDLFIMTPIVDTETERYGTTYKNFGSSQVLSAMMNYRKTFFKIWTTNLTVQGAYVMGKSHDEFGAFENSGGYVVIQLNNNITITPALSAELTGFYMSKQHAAYLTLQPQANISAGLRQMLMKNKLSLSLTVNDIFYTFVEEMTARYDKVNYTIVSKRDSRYINLTIRYNFGSTTVRAARNKTTGIEDEASRARR